MTVRPVAPSDKAVQTLAGVALAVISFALVLLARAQLVKSFAVTPQAKDLVTHGLYSRLQHPMYSSI